MGGYTSAPLFARSQLQLYAQGSAPLERFVWRKDRTLGFLVCKVKIPESSELGLKVRV